MHVNDKYLIHPHCKIVLFADVACITISTKNTNFLMQLCRDVFLMCCDWLSYRLALNVKETYFVIIGNVSKTCTCPYHLTVVLLTKYLLQSI